MAKTLRLWNGRGILCRNHNDPRWDKVPSNNAPSAYIAAYSRADARRLIAEYCGKMPPDSEIAVYFHEGAWGDHMKGVTPERGLWLGFDYKNPVRVI